MKLSVIVPSYKDKYLNQTVADLLAKSELGDQLEVIVVLDGYWQEVMDDPRVRVVHLGGNRGMRGAINAGVLVSRGEYIMRTDEHCIFGQGYDQILTRDCQKNWIMTATRFFLDPVTWTVMDDIPPVNYEKLVIQGHVKFCGFPWKSRDQKRHRIPVDRTMAMQGSMWLMSREWWDKVIVELESEGYGTHYQDSHEMVFKTWQAGGELMLNKRTWFAHKHRKFPRAHAGGSPEHPTDPQASWKYALDKWLPYYQEVVKPLWNI